MSTQQEIDLEARIAALEQQIAEMAAKINPLYAGGMDRYIHSGYLQWDGIGMRFDDNGQQVLIPDGNSVNSQFWVARLSNNPSLPPVGPKIQIGGAWTTSSPERVTYSILAALTPTSIGNGPNSALTMQGRSDLALVQLAADFEDDGAGVYLKLVDDASNPRIVWSLDGGVNEYDLGGGGLKTSGGGYYLIPAGPSIGTAVTSSASADTYGSWTQMRAASGNALYIVGLDVKPADNSSLDYIQIDIGTGGAGSETSVGEAKTIARLHTNGSQWGTYKIELPYPIPVAASTRIACRTADDVASALAHEITLHVIDQADVVSI